MGNGPWRLVAVFVIVPLLVVPGVVHVLALVALQEPDRICARCHAPRVALETWQRSTHSGARCAECHAPASGVVERETAVLALLMRCLRRAATGERAGTTVSNEVCLRCHSRFYDVKQLSATRHVAHPHGRCVDCHRGLVHGVYDRDALVLALRDKGASLHVDADFPKRLREGFSDREHFQHGFVKTMAFCGRCHRMAATTAATQQGRALPRSPVCETCHVRY